jgi:cyclic pyranopterin phosphate synthase
MRPIKEPDVKSSEQLSHFDRAGNAVMVDVSAKEASARRAVATGRILMERSTRDLIQNGTAAKGDVLGVARIAGIMAAKQTARLIPLCHPLIFERCTLDFELEDAGVGAVCAVSLHGKTGAEMEALTGVSVALLTIYDMCKAVDRAMVISEIALSEKSGGKSGHWKREGGGERR